MATFSFNNQMFPVGATVTAYLAANRVPGGAPTGAQVSSATVAADSTVTLASLAADTAYVAYSLVGGEHRYLTFRTPTADPSSAGTTVSLAGDVSLAPRANPSVMSNPPSIVIGLQDTASTISGSVLKTWDDPAFEIFGASPVLALTGFSGAGGVTTRNAVTSMAITNDATYQDGAPWRIEFEFDDDVFEIKYSPPAAATPKLRLWVDGQVAQPYQTLLVGSSGDVSFLAAVDLGSRAPRHIMLEVQNFAFGGIRHRPTANISKPQGARGPRVMWVGDSHVEGAGGTGVFTGFTHVASWLLGWRDFWTSGVGGSGWLATGGTGKVAIPARVASDVVAFSPDLVIWEAGANDANVSVYTTANVKAAAKTAIQAAQAALPRAKHILIGPVQAIGPTSNGSGDNTVALTAAFNALATELGIMRLDPITNPVITGTGNAGSPNGTGNSDIYGDGSHFNDDGHYYAGRVYAARLARVLESA